ncbi:MAG: ribosomal protein S18-alanine N-acetyltransferase [Bacillota bacterium]|nr:ribosomal protein S18-alanine N-acetyltransferase [Bacillota bacterium]
MSAGVSIRPGVPEDAEAMAALDRICFAVPWSQESFRQELEENDLALYLAAEDSGGALAGYAGLWLVAGAGHITNVAVRPDCRRQGLGKKLLLALFREAADQGAEAFTLEVRPSNEAALALYQSLGFTQEGRRKKYYADNGEDALILWLRQPAPSGE